MSLESNLPQRKNIRYHGFDYSSNGAYFITVCTLNRRNILSKVGDGASTSRDDDYNFYLTSYGKIVEKYLLSSENIKNVKVDKYVIMPNHIHVIFFIRNEDSITAPSPNEFRDVEAPSPTNMMIPHVISAFKRLCIKEIGENIFQRSYYDHIIRDNDDYVRCKNYILQNPRNWRLDELYTE